MADTGNCHVRLPRAIDLSIGLAVGTLGCMRVSLGEVGEPLGRAEPATLAAAHG